MEISSINFIQSISPKTSNLTNKTTNSNVSFKGGFDEKNIPSSEHCTIYFHPMFELQKQLLEDGYTLEEIKKHQIFDIIEIKNFDFSNPNLVEDALEGKITKDDIFSHKTKKLADIKAIQKAYILLKQKFNTPDVQKHLAWVEEIENDIAASLKARGIETTHRTTEKSMILEILHRVDKDNVKLLEELLNDKNFNNIFISTALMKIDKNKDMKPAQQVLKMAQEIGYEKDFSEALAIILSEAEANNLSLIEKMLYEQDFLIQNKDFVCDKLISFLRVNNLKLAYLYATTPEIDLKVIDELME